MRVAAALLFCLSLWIPDAISQDLSPPEDQDASGDDLELSGSGSGDGVFVVPDTKVALKFNATTPSARQLETSPFSLTTVSNPISEIELEKLVTLAPPTTTGSTSTTHKAVAVPIDRETEPQNTQLQVTSASPTTGGQGATPRGRKVMPKEGTSEPYAITTASAVVDVAMKETASAPEEKDHPPAAPTLPPPATTMPSWAEPNPASSTPLLSDYGRINEDIVPGVATNVGSENDSDFALVEDFSPEVQGTQEGVSENQSLLERKEVLAGVIAGGIVGLAFAVMLVSLMVYRMKKKDEGSYSLDEQKHPNSGYQKPHKQEEFLA